MNKLFVFDLDNTLIDNEHDYSKPILDMALLIVESLGNLAPHVRKIINMQEDIDSRRVKEINPETEKLYLYSMERFPSSCVEVYKEICRQASVTAERKVEDKLYTIGMGAFDKTRYAANIKSHALPILNFLKQQQDIIILCTKGDSQVQNNKIAALKSTGIDHFDEIQIIEDKSSKDFERIAKLYPGYSYYSVGDSYKSDIATAIEASFTGIYIPVEGWETLGKMDEILAKVDKNHCFVFEALKDIKTHYKEL